MKRFAPPIAALLLLCSCNDSVVKIDSLAITPETATVFTDEALPELSLSATPQDALEGTEVTWTSSNTALVTVAEDGTLEFAVKDIEGEETVTVTASAGKKTATCTINVKGQICRYGIIDMSAEFGLLLLDRNIGASAAGKAGNYYQKGCNTPVAYEGDEAVNSEYKTDWSAESEGYIDWSKPENTPCPKGWRIPDGDDMTAINKKLEAIALYEWDMATKEEYNAALDVLDKMQTAVSGRFQPDKKIPDAECFWSTFINTSGGLGAFENNNFPNFTKSYNYTVAIPVRCVKDAENK